MRQIVLTLLCGVVRMWGGGLVCCGGVLWVGRAWNWGRGVPISKLALGLVPRSRALVGPILKFERPTPFAVRLVGQVVQLGRLGQPIEMPVK